MKAYPRWFYQDPAKHVKFESERKEPEPKLSPREELEKLFDDKERNEQK